MRKMQQITTDALSNAYLNLIMSYKTINVFYENSSVPVVTHIMNKGLKKIKSPTDNLEFLKNE